MTDTHYIASLQRHLAEYKASVLGVAESGVWGIPPRPYAHILPVQQRRLNIVAPIRERFWREQYRRGWKLHPHFHHLTSSQALAFNLLFSIYPQVPSRMTLTRKVLGLSKDVPLTLEFEKVLDIREQTNLDALISTAEGCRTIIEIKLTERTFGKAPSDARHIAKLEEIYRPALAGRVEDKCFDLSAFFRDYQLYRNVAQIRRDSSDRLLLLLPRTRTQLWQHATEWCDARSLGSLREHITVVALEDVVAALAADFAGIEDASKAIADVSQKYVPAAG
jgi:hypothetical protein